MDLFGPLKTSQSKKKYIMVVTDAFTKYVKLIAIPDKQAKKVSSAMFTKWLCRHGLPDHIVSNGGKKWFNEIVNKMMMMVKNTATSPYHPQTNIQVKVCNKTVAQYFKTQHTWLETAHGPNGICMQHIIPQNYQNNPI